MADEPTLADLASELVSESTEDVKQETVAQDTTTEESSPEETEQSAAEDSPEDQSQSEDAASEDQEADEQAETDETTGEEQPLSKGEERKQDLQTEIRDLVSQRNAIRQEVEQLNQQAYAPQSVQDLVGEGYSETDARVLAMEQKLEIQDYNNRIADSQLTLHTESQRVISDFPMFNPESDQYNQPVADQAAQILRSALVQDPNTGQIVASNVSPYQLYKTIADAHQAAAVENQIAGQKATETMLASAEPQSSAAPKTSKEDPFLTGLLGK